MSLNSQTRSQIRFTLTDFFWAAILAAIVGFSAAVATAQTCTPPLYQGNVNSCQGVSIRFLNRNSVSQIDYYTVRWNTDGLCSSNNENNRIGVPCNSPLAKLPGSALSASRTDVGCNWASHVTITQFLSGGGSCSTASTGPAPHSFPCSLCSTSAQNGATTVHAANYRQGLAPNAIAAVFPDAGQSFTDQTAFASGFPLPTVLGGVSITMAGVQCELLSVTPGQINFHIPSDADPGPTDIPVQILTTRGSAPQFLSRAQTNPSAPGIFTLASNGTGPAASNWLIVKPNGLQIWQNAGSLSFNAADRIFLVLYGTGINETRSQIFISTSSFAPLSSQFAEIADFEAARKQWIESVIAAGQSYDAFYTGPSWMTGVQQLVYEIPKSQLANWPSVSGAFVRVGVPGRSWDSQGFDLRK